MTVLAPAHSPLTTDRFVAPPATDFERRLNVLREHGSFSMAYHTLQPGLRYFETPLGYVAYERRWGLDLVLCDPVCHAVDRADLLGDFLRHRGKVVFCQVTRPVAQVLASHGYRVNEMGTEFDLDLRTWQPAGKRMAHVREGDNRLRREGYRLVEIPAAELDRERLQQISDGWRATKRVRRETRFLSRGIVFEDEPDVRKFSLLDRDGQLVGWFTFDPIYESGEVVGYLSNQKRWVDGLPRDFEFGVHRQAIDRFRDEGKRLLALGLCPFHDVTDEEFDANPLTSRFFQWAYRRDRGSRIGFRGVAEHKRRYRGEPKKVYFASKARSNVVRLLAVAQACRLF